MPENPYKSPEADEATLLSSLPLTERITIAKPPERKYRRSDAFVPTATYFPLIGALLPIAWAMVRLVYSLTLYQHERGPIFSFYHQYWPAMAACGALAGFAVACCVWAYRRFVLP